MAKVRVVILVADQSSMYGEPIMDTDYFKPTSERFVEALENARRHWQKRREASTALSSLGARVPPPFTIALNCETGANGPAVARAIGDRLGWHVYDHELVERIAQEIGVRADLLASVDEKRMSWLLEILQGFTSGPTVSESAYVHRLAETLLSLAAHGECIIVGRGAAQVLPPATTLRVRLVGPLKDRIAAIQRRYGCSTEQASRWVEETDRERKAFIEDHFYKDITDPHQYDLVLDAFRFPPTQSAELVVTALRQLQRQPLAPVSPPSTRSA
jgi:hypothetical protein